MTVKADRLRSGHVPAGLSGWETLRSRNTLFSIAIGNGRHGTAANSFISSGRHLLLPIIRFQCQVTDTVGLVMMVRALWIRVGLGDIQIVDYGRLISKTPTARKLLRLI